jgi:hypothetical protein
MTKFLASVSLALMLLLSMAALTVSADWWTDAQQAISRLSGH